VNEVLDPGEFSRLRRKAINAEYERAISQLERAIVTATADDADALRRELVETRAAHTAARLAFAADHDMPTPPIVVY
jgi:hypothetical protein